MHKINYHYDEGKKKQTCNNIQRILPHDSHIEFRTVNPSMNQYRVMVRPNDASYVSEDPFFLVPVRSNLLKNSKYSNYFL